MSRPERATFRTLFGNVAMVLLLVLLLPIGIILLVAPLALLVRAAIEIAGRM